MNMRIVEIDLDAEKHNIQEIKKHIGKAKFMAIVKADAYGHGMMRIAENALKNGADWLGVATVEEGRALREAGIEANILVMGGIFEDSAQAVIEYSLSQTVFDIDIIKILQIYAKKSDKKAKIHIKIDTGMGRIGISPDDFPLLLDTIEACPDVELEGLFTHYANSDDDKEYTKGQIAVFEQAIKILHDRGYSPIIHASNSAASIDLPGDSFDMVRVGISMYGCYSSVNVSRENVKLQPVMRFKANVVMVKEVAEGTFIGYGCTFKTQRRSKIATVSIGYGDGYPRILSNRGSALVRGKRAKIAGRICMDQMMLDVTDIEGVSVGDEVVLWGKQGEAEIHVDEIAELCKTISYEILLGVSPRVQRIYIGGDSDD